MSVTEVLLTKDFHLTYQLLNSIRKPPGYKVMKCIRNLELSNLYINLTKVTTKLTDKVYKTHFIFYSFIAIEFKIKIHFSFLISDLERPRTCSGRHQVHLQMKIFTPDVRGQSSPESQTTTGSGSKVK